MKKTYIIPDLSILRMEYQKHLMDASGGSSMGPTADFMSSPTVSGVKANHADKVQDYSVWNDDWSE